MFPFTITLAGLTPLSSSLAECSQEQLQVEGAL